MLWARKARPADIARDFEMMEWAPRHIESTAQVIANLAGGGSVDSEVGQTKPMNRGGLRSGLSASSVAHTVGCKEPLASASISDVSEPELASRMNAASPEWLVELSLTSPTRLSNDVSR